MAQHHSQKSTLGNRREFVRTTLALGAAGLAAGGANSALASDRSAHRDRKSHWIEAGDTVLFQGDSITDAHRDRKAEAAPNRQALLGNGYVGIAAASMLVDRPEDDLKIFNRGISADKVYQLADRWQKDCLDLRPDVLSILIGVNDVAHRLRGKFDGTVEIYEQGCLALFEQARKASPKIKLVVCEPFVLRCGAVTDKWFPLFDEYRAAARRVAKATEARFVPFQTMFDRAIQYAPPEHWASDGIHPTAIGAALMAHTWLKTVGS